MKARPGGPVYWEILTFVDPETRIPAIDRLEGFHPGGPCLYRRVLVSAQANGTERPVWLYVVEVTSNRSFKPLPSGKWRSCNQVQSSRGFLLRTI